MYTHLLMYSWNISGKIQETGALAAPGEKQVAGHRTGGNLFIHTLLYLLYIIPCECNTY